MQSIKVLNPEQYGERRRVHLEGKAENIQDCPSMLLPSIYFLFCPDEKSVSPKQETYSQSLISYHAIIG